MKFFIDEDLSPTLVDVCHEYQYDATCSRNRGMLQNSDTEVARLCASEGRILVTNNAGDFFKLLGDSEVHPGLIILPLGTRDDMQSFLKAALAKIMERGSTPDELAGEMINTVIEVAVDGKVNLFIYPPESS